MLLSHLANQEDGQCWYPEVGLTLPTDSLLGWGCLNAHCGVGGEGDARDLPIKEPLISLPCPRRATLWLASETLWPMPSKGQRDCRDTGACAPPTPLLGNPLMAVA